VDYAFVPGVTLYEKRLQRLLDARPNTTLITKYGLTSVAGFLGELKSQSVKAGNLVVGGHANDDRWAIDFDSVTKPPLGSTGNDYEMLKEVEKAKTMYIPSEIRSDGIKFHVKGCEIGSVRAQPFLTLLKSALDNPQQVTAPQYLHALASDADRGVFEYMQYDFVVVSKTPVQDTPTLVQEFQNQHFKTGVEVGGTEVEIPPENWKKWIKYGLNLAPASRDEVAFDIYTTLDPPIMSGGVKLTHLSTDSASCVTAVEGLAAVPIPMNGNPIPDGDAARLAFAKSRLPLSGPMQDPKFPMYVRFGFNDFESFWNGLEWSVTVPDSKDKLLLSGQHYVYHVRIPITKAGGDKLIFNYYPKTGKPRINFTEDKTKFVLFGAV